MIVGIDTGGTFTDFVCFDGQNLRQHKVLSTPQSPESAILQGLKEMHLKPKGLTIIHGSTVATNAVLEGKGAKVVYIANKGLGDVLKIGRQARKELYNLTPIRQPTLVENSAIIEVDCRLDANGEEISSLREADLKDLRAKLQNSDFEAVAVNLLFSYKNPQQEQKIQQAIPQHLFTSLSHQVLPQYKEYERGITTWLNAYVGLIMQKYLKRLQSQLADSQLSIMQSSGGTLSADHAARFAVQLLLSGPAGGLNGALAMAKQVGIEKILTFDMGGTSTDVAILDGQIRLAQEGRIADMPIAVPMVDMHTIGAGGGSIARVDEGGLLQVGPQSAGANPGPACYDQGGKQATVTDANVVLGRIQADFFTASNLQLNTAKAFAAVQTIADALNLDVYQAAAGILQIAEQHMAEALRLISIKKGLDPRDYVLTCFGGAGGLHICALADALGMTRAMVPPLAGVLSAYGMLVAPKSVIKSQTLMLNLHKASSEQLQKAVKTLQQLSASAFAKEVSQQATAEQVFRFDCRYLGQSHTLTQTLSVDNKSKVQINADELINNFSCQHQQLYGYSLKKSVELVNLSVETRESNKELFNSAQEKKTPSQRRTLACYIQGKEQQVHYYKRQQLTQESQVNTPAIIIDPVSTVYIAPDWQVKISQWGHILLEKQNEQTTNTGNRR